MKSLALLFLVIAVVFITMGYMERKMVNQEENKIIEYRFVPRTLLEEQIYSIDLKKNFSDMFEKEDASVGTALL